MGDPAVTKKGALEALLSAALCGVLAGACGHGRTMATDDRQPTVDMGVGATILMPGQSAPMPSRSATPGSGRVGQTGGGNLSMIGGASQDILRDRERGTELGTRAIDKEKDLRGDLPGWAKIVAAPFALAAWPFKKLAEALEDDPEPAVPDPAAQTPPGTTPARPATAAPAPPLDPQAARERAEIEAMERQLAQRRAATLPTPAADPEAWQGGAYGNPEPRSSPARAPSIAEELALLQAGIAPRPRPEQRSAGATAAAPSAGLADRVLDRDGNGRPDLWQYHDASGAPTRELLDEDGDGAPDRTVFFDPATGQEDRVEEDTNLDGRIDSWIEYDGGQMARQRRDTDYDGFLDTWSFYRAGQLARQEQDLNGDGFRNRVTFFQDGLLTREREDRNGDGRVDRVSLYDREETLTRRDEDSDGDGLVDIRSHYQQGKLVRRELLSDQVGTSIEEEELSSAAWTEAPRESRPRTP